MASNTVLLTNIHTLYQTRSGISGPIRGKELSQLPSIEKAYLWIKEGIISEFGPMSESPQISVNTIDCQGKSVLPAWCDSHSHIVYAGSRENEFVDKIHGLSYEEIAKRGGGILNSAAKLRLSSEDELYNQAIERLHEVIGYGTGALEIKSGYGLTKESELKMLRVIKRLKESTDCLIKSSFLAAHSVPPEFKNNREAYVDHIINDMLPEVADEGLADYMDVFCDRGFFTPADTDKLLEAGWKYGLKPKIHANELDFSGGVQTGVKHNAVSVDHLECVDDPEIKALLHSNTMPTLLPTTAFFLKLEYAPARKMIDAGLPVAIATDYNPGSSPSGKMSFVISLSCIYMKMLPEEAINAATINGAYAMELERSHGMIAKGMAGNVIITKNIPSLAYLPYSFGSELIDKVILKGNIQ
ncbi:MAG: imidazolonepropionase [Saprospiraceae bacterium]|nr:imidazolonepropionase [Saprospiraceae bacterium]